MSICYTLVSDTHYTFKIQMGFLRKHWGPNAAVTAGSSCDTEEPWAGMAAWQRTAACEFLTCSWNQYRRTSAVTGLSAQR